MKINPYGFLVLRKPEFNFDDQGGRGAYLPFPPNINNLYYGGIDRMPWFDFEEDFFCKKLPEEFIELKNKITSYNNFPFDFKLCKDFNITKMILDYSNKIIIRNEINAIYSNKFINEEKLDQKCNIEWIGVDIYCHGFGSIIRQGLFNKPKLFSNFLEHINLNGLFKPNDIFIKYYIDQYIMTSKANDLEVIDDAIENLDEIVIGKIRQIDEDREIS